jgi:hypothetical protein
MITRWEIGSSYLHVRRIISSGAVISPNLKNGPRNLLLGAEARRNKEAQLLFITN